MFVFDGFFPSSSETNPPPQKKKKNEKQTSEETLPSKEREVRSTLDSAYRVSTQQSKQFLTQHDTRSRK
jgi:hypothetical protein